MEQPTRSAVHPEAETAPPLPVVGTAAEPVYLHALDGPYLGSLPAYYDAEQVDAARQLRSQADAVMDDVARLLRDHGSALRTNFTPGGYQDAGWRTLNLGTDGLRYHANCALVPTTAAICEALPGYSSAQIGVLGPGCRLQEHHGDTNVVHRIHLGLVIPGSLPELGIAVAGEERTWTEGEVLVFEDAHRHTVWNDTAEARIILVVDAVKPELRHRRRWLQAQAGCGILLQFLSARAPFVRRLPRPVLRALLALAAGPVLIATAVQRRADPSRLRR